MRLLPAAPQSWSRRSLLTLLTASVAVAALLLLGAALGVWYLIVDHHDTTADPTDRRNAATPEDRLAAEPLPRVATDAAHPQPLTTAPVDTLRLPAAIDQGPAGVTTGYPRTPEGALAQLAAIDRAALESGTVAGAQQVIAAWSTPDGPTAETWSGVAAIKVLLSSAGLPATGSPTLTIRLDPAMGLIKGTLPDPSGSPNSPPEFVIPCIDFVLTVTDATTARAATADCQRMVWQHDPERSKGAGRWVIGPGPEPAAAPSVWPGTAAAAEAGYLDLETP
jgi:hypothetical protein